jgi:hypothetical protein
MIEANEDITLVAEQQVRDVEQGMAQAKAIAEGREIHPALLAQPQANSPADQLPAQAEHAHTLQQEPVQPPPDPEATFRHVRLGIVVAVTLVLFLLWLRQKKS